MGRSLAPVPVMLPERSRAPNCDGLANELGVREPDHQLSLGERAPSVNRGTAEIEEPSHRRAEPSPREAFGPVPALKENEV